MCLKYVKIASKSSCGIRYSYVPCGKCEDCRRKMEQAWLFRMNSEFIYLKNQGWNVAFCTLTYTDDNLPHVPEECFKDPTQYRDIACFSRTQVREWIDSIRHYCKRHYRMVKGDNLRYFIASEYGEESHRPHYHAILAWPPRCDYQTMHALCTHYWNHGLLFPRDFRGDGSKCMSFEVVGDASKVLAYCSKYVCKDLAFFEECGDVEFYNHKDYEEGTDEYAYGKMYADTVPFHIQSKSLGFEPYKNMSDEEKLQAYNYGQSFSNDGKVYMLPVYLKNKLVFDPYYVIDDEGNRLSLRRANEFFEKYRNEIFTHKAQVATLRLTKISTTFMVNSGVSPDDCSKVDEVLKYYRKAIAKVSPEVFNGKYHLGELYLAYSKVDYSHCYDIPLVEQWMLRYRDPELVALDCFQGEWPQANTELLSWLQLYFDYIDSCYALVGQVHLGDREAATELSKRIRDFYSNIVS